MILYFGNILSASGNNPSFIELLTPKLKTLYPVVTASAKKNKFLRMLDMLWLLLKHLNNAKVILIDTYSYQGFYYAWILSKISFLFSIPYIPIIHGGHFMHRVKTSPRQALSFLKNANHVVVPSLFMQHELQSIQIDTLYIPNFIEVSDYVFNTRTRLRPRLIWVRSFHNIYNPLLAIEVLALLNKKGITDIHLCMVGPDKDGTQALCRKFVKDKSLDALVTFTGKLTKQEIRDLSLDYDIFINTSTIDNLPVSIIEAMALGLLVVSTNVGGIPYMVRDGHEGMLVPPDQPVAFVNVIEQLLTNDALVTLLQQNARMKAEAYDWVVVQKKWKHLLAPYFSL